MLQPLQLEICSCNSKRPRGPPLDLVALQDVPHVRVHFHDPHSLQLAAGLWQSLEVISCTAFSIAFCDRRRFVTGTTESLVMGAEITVKNTVQAVKRACAM